MACRRSAVRSRLAPPFFKYLAVSTFPFRSQDTTAIPGCKIAVREYAEFPEVCGRGEAGCWRGRRRRGEGTRQTPFNGGAHVNLSLRPRPTDRVNLADSSHSSIRSKCGMAGEPVRSGKHRRSAVSLGGRARRASPGSKTLALGASPDRRRKSAGLSDQNVGALGAEHALARKN